MNFFVEINKTYCEDFTFSMDIELLGCDILFSREYEVVVQYVIFENSYYYIIYRL